MTKKNQNSSTEFVISGLAWYRKSQWDKLLKVSEDSDQLEDTFEEWLQGAEKFVNNFDNANVILKKVDVDIEELIKWCEINNYPINSESRAFFTIHKVKEIS